MKRENRTVNSFRNTTIGLIQQLLTICVKFFTRAIFIRILGNQILGLNSIFTELLTMLSLADLGLGTATVYSFYKPLAENDTDKLSALLFYYKKIYNLIAGAILTFGIAIIPVLKFIVRLDDPLPWNQIYLYYILFLVNTVASYLCAYKANIITADQKQYIISLYTLIVDIACMILQVIIMLVTKKYSLYLLLNITRTLAYNIMISAKAKRLFPCINKKIELKKESRKDVFINIKSVFLYKISNVLFNSTDNILISILIGTVYSGFYSTYMLVIHNVSQLLQSCFRSITSSIGNLNQEADVEKQESIFNSLLLISHWIGGVCSICIYMLIQDFVILFADKSSLLSHDVMLLLVIILYLTIVLLPITCYREAVGLFNKTKYIMLISAILNIILSVLLGECIGMSGIFIASIISKLVTYFWYEPYVLYTTHFHKNVLHFMIKFIKYLLLTLVYAFILNYFVQIKVTGWFMLILKGAVIFIIVNIMYLVTFWRSKDFGVIRGKIHYILCER